MPPVTTIKNNATTTAKGRAKITPAQLRIRPARAGTPCRFATHPCQTPRTFSNGATTTTRRPPLAKSWKNNQHPRMKNRRPRAPKAGIRSLPFYRLVSFARRKVARSHVATNRPYCQGQTAGCRSPGRAWCIRGCHRRLRYFGVAATSHPQPFIFNVGEVSHPLAPSPNPLELEDRQASR